ncbi:MAG TPA: 2-phosphosulfolactate phosphatase [Fusobacterium sp.]|uniref:2-phosphosulfolactate phosphatase n=1 Tax=Fusobacterium sp. TaxID=68766 RepID=UPI002F3EE8A2
MKIDVFLTAEEAKRKAIHDSNIVVIDVLRATSVMITAIAHGVSKIYPYESIEEVREASPASSFSILCGERKGLDIDGFDYGNSPLEYQNDTIQGAEMFMTTTNGTRALRNIHGKNNRIWIASFLNLSSMSTFLAAEKKDCIVLCAGTENQFSLDDALCAGMLIQKLQNYEKSDIALALEILAKNSENIDESLHTAKHYRYLKSIGLEKDLEYCCTPDQYSLLLEYDPNTNSIHSISS